MPPARISVDRLVRRYPSGDSFIAAVDGVSFEITAGERVALTGPSGSGKPTRLAVIGGLERPTSGAVVVDGRDVGTLAADALARFRRCDVAFVFQAFRLLPQLTARENVALPGLLAGMTRAAASNRARELLDRVGLRARGEHRPARLSAGEQQRVAAARALMNEPRVLLADEPTGNLDAAAATGLLDLLDELHHERALTLLVATHARDVAARADRVIDLRAGRIVG